MIQRIAVKPLSAVAPAVLRRLVVCASAWLWSMVAVLAADERTDFFERKIRPVLVEHCYDCHSVDGDREGGLRLDTREAIRQGGESGPAVVPKNAEASMILSALRYDGLEMPPDQKLPDKVVRDFEHWIAAGAADPREEQEHAPEVIEKTDVDYAQGRKFWSLLPAEVVEPDEHSLDEWSRGRIDDYIAAGLEQAELSPSASASLPVLLRRLSFDLVGLPPTTADPLASTDPEVLVGEFVDQLLSSEAFGEHWARMWLDLMRYADDQAHIVGNNQSLFFPNAHRYRDWVIEAWNSDLPFDRFIKLQLAADLLTPEDPSDDVALGFVGLGPKYYRRGSPEVKADEWEDRVDVLSRGLLGLTVACARCHDHKYDPIATADYYALAGVFASVEMYNRPLKPDSKRDGKGQAKDPKEALHIIRDIAPRDLPVMIRGDVNRKGPVVPRGYLAVLNRSAETAEQPDQRMEFQNGSGRLELAEQIVSSEVPLAARVFVNRVWGRLIGKPLVETESNFGSLGGRPSHPELLDDLTLRFIDNGWSFKWLCREIVMSATYQQSSLGANPGNDPENRWLSRMNRKRMRIEQWRDAVLLAADRLDDQSTQEHLESDDIEANRRTVYCDVSRLKLNPMLALFDFPDPNVHSDGRAETITATQKLFLLNSPFMVENARRIADAVANESEEESQYIQRLYRRLFSREPTPQEEIFARDFLAYSNLATYVHALMLSNENFTID